MGIMLWVLGAYLPLQLNGDHGVSWGSSCVRVKMREVRFPSCNPSLPVPYHYWCANVQVCTVLRSFIHLSKSGTHEEANALLSMCTLRKVIIICSLFINISQYIICLLVLHYACFRRTLWTRIAWLYSPISSIHAIRIVYTLVLITG